MEVAADEQLFDLINDLQSQSRISNYPTRGGSRPGRSPNVDRNHDKGRERLFRDYFVQQLVYNRLCFRSRFLIGRERFMQLIYRIKDHDTFFVYRKDRTGKLGLSTLQKDRAALRILSYGYTPDTVDEYLPIGESTAMVALAHFVPAINTCYEYVYLRSSNEEDFKTIFAQCNKERFPGASGIIDCSKRVWKNCTTAWNGQFKGKEGVTIITIEAILDSTLWIWIWHLFVGIPGSSNDMNVVEASTL